MELRDTVIFNLRPGVIDTVRVITRLRISLRINTNTRISDGTEIVVMIHVKAGVITHCIFKIGTHKQYRHEGSSLFLLQLYLQTHKQESHINKSFKPVFVALSSLSFAFLEKYVLRTAKQYVFGSFPLA